MGIGDALTELGSFLDDCEGRGVSVERVDLSEVTGARGGRLRADLALRLSVEEADVTSLCDPHLDTDGTVRFALPSTTELVPVGDHDVTVGATASAFDGECVTLRVETVLPGESDTGVDLGGRDDATDPTGAVTGLADGPTVAGSPVSAAASGSAERPASVQASDASGGARPGADTEQGEISRGLERDETDATEGSASDRDLPPFKNPDLLAEVYETCDTFAEMADELEMDVTAETVRRYMIDFDIHEPNTYQTADDTADEQVVLSDGIGLPDDVTAEDLVETVERSNTIYEVKQDIDIERDDALEMLQDLNLLDLVVGRLATEGEREVTRDDIVDRLRDASAVQ